MARRANTSWGGYVAKAFTWRWNMLGFGAAMLAAMISGVPDIAIPVVLAAEVAYLGMLSGNPKFQKAIEAQDHKEQKGQKEQVSSQDSQDKVSNVLRRLNHDRQFRFTDLRRRCLEMQTLAAGVRGHAQDKSDALHLASLDRMLWVFLRLLASQQSLEQFLLTTDAFEMQDRVEELEKRIEKAQAEKNEKILRALIDSMSTAQLRLDNWRKAEQNSEFVEIELDRIEDKIQALVEMAVGHEDPDFISSQVESVAASVLDTENVMREMSFMTGLEDDLEEDAPPSILATENA